MQTLFDAHNFDDHLLNESHSRITRFANIHHTFISRARPIHGSGVISIDELCSFLKMAYIIRNNKNNLTGKRIESFAFIPLNSNKHALFKVDWTGFCSTSGQLSFRLTLAGLENTIPVLGDGLYETKLKKDEIPQELKLSTTFNDISLLHNNEFHRIEIVCYSDSEEPHINIVGYYKNGEPPPDEESYIYNDEEYEETYESFILRPWICCLSALHVMFVK